MCLRTNRKVCVARSVGPRNCRHPLAEKNLAKLTWILLSRGLAAERKIRKFGLVAGSAACLAPTSDCMDVKVVILFSEVKLQCSESSSSLLPRNSCCPLTALQDFSLYKLSHFSKMSPWPFTIFSANHKITLWHFNSNSNLILSPLQKQPLSYSEILNCRRRWYLVVSLLLGSTCCIWNSLSWNFGVVYRSCRTKFGRFFSHQ